MRAVFPGDAYRTPLGDIPVDVELAKLIVSKSDLVRFDARGHETGASRRAEHALEVQLPFLRSPWAISNSCRSSSGDQSAPVAEALGTALGEALRGKKVLIVASTDLSHFHDDAEARALDGDFQRRLALFDPAALLKALASKTVEACGGGPVVSAMLAARSLGAAKCVVLMYANSGDVTGDRSGVVGYLSAAMVKEKRESKAAGKSRANAADSPAPEGNAADGSKARTPRAHAELTRNDKVFLLTLARSAIEAECRGKKLTIPPPPSPIMREPRGAFVTLKKGGRLRGCIGYIEAIKPLAETIEEMAKAAAFSDWRFNPVQAEEIPEIEIEISVLSPLSEVRDPSTVVVGRHGLIVSRGSKRGVLLPQVPTEWGWDRETFLAQTCAKADLPESSWKERERRSSRSQPTFLGERARPAQIASRSHHRAAISASAKACMSAMQSAVPANPIAGNRSIPPTNPPAHAPSSIPRVESRRDVRAPLGKRGPDNDPVIRSRQAIPRIPQLQKRAARPEADDMLKSSEQRRPEHRSPGEEDESKMYRNERAPSPIARASPSRTRRQPRPP